VTADRSLSRRRWLATLAAAALAGCGEADDPSTVGADPSVDTGSTAGESPTSSPTRTATAIDTAAETTTDGPAEATADEAVTTATEGTATPTATPVHADYETTAVEVATPDGEVLGSVTAAVADTPDLRYLGLSDTESLPEDRGMLFVYDSMQDLTFVMRRMDFGIDIVYADADGRITSIHHAPAPGPDENGASQTYPGRGQYVLEVNYGWTTDRGVEEGDVLRFDR
jgi:uncharacterized membrane protein (UPF0127 family)